MTRCQEKTSFTKQTLAEKIKQKGPGILRVTPAPDPSKVSILESIPKSVVKTDLPEKAKNVEVDLDLIFNKA